MDPDAPPEIIDADADWARFLKNRYKKQLSELSREYPYRKSLFIDYRELQSFGKAGIRMADKLLVNPGSVFDEARSAVEAHQLVKTKEGKAAEGINIRF